MSDDGSLLDHGEGEVLSPGARLVNPHPSAQQQDDPPRILAWNEALRLAETYDCRVCGDVVHLSLWQPFEYIDLGEEAVFFSQRCVFNHDAPRSPIASDSAPVHRYKIYRRGGNSRPTTASVG